MANITKPPLLDETGEKYLKRIAMGVETIAGAQANPDSDTWEKVRNIVRSGNAAKYFHVGDQFSDSWTFDGTTTTLVWDVVHHYDGSDENHPLVTLADGSQEPGMLIQCHYAIPQSIVFSSKQPFYVAQSDMAAGTYSFTVNTQYAWGKGFASAVGKRTYQFTTAKSHPKGSVFLWNANDGSQVKKVTVKDTASGADSESLDVTEASGGTMLGSIGQTESDAGFNSIPRACFGSNNYMRSDLRSWLNSDDAAWHYDGGDPFHMPHPLDGKAGFLAGLTDGLRSALARVKVQTQPHPFDGAAIQTTYDYVYPVSAREHGFNNFLSNTAEGFNAEGVPLDYWTRLRTASGRTSWNGWSADYPELITCDAANHGTSRHVWYRSANRNGNAATTVGCVYTSGDVSHGHAFYGYYAAPAACIG